MGKKEKKLKVICPFCNAKQPLSVEVAIMNTQDGCDTCGYGQGASGKVDVHCASCKRLMYSKEFDEEY